MQWIRGAAFVACAFGLAACADLTSISRKSSLPSSTTVDGRAIHLDAKQRVVLAKAGTRDRPADIACAEPSPDALSAFASSISGGVSVSGQGAGSAASALSEAAASIGLRTQSITLMRDALYRVCEAYYNNALSPWQVMALMQRSQDLTAAVVSVEQLTGAVVAQQAALGGASGAASSATMLSNTEALGKMRELKKKYEDEIKAIEEEQKTAVPDNTRKQQALTELDGKIATAPDAATKNQLEGQRIGVAQTASDSQAKVDDLSTRLELKKSQLADVEKSLAAIEAQLDSSITSASAEASSTAKLSGGSVVNRLDKETAIAISKAVFDITTSVVNKSYVVADCMTLLATPGALPESNLGIVTLTCLDAIKAKAQADIALSAAAAVAAANSAAQSARELERAAAARPSATQQTPQSQGPTILPTPATPESQTTE